MKKLYTIALFILIFMRPFSALALDICEDCDQANLMAKLTAAESGDYSANTTIKSGGRTAQTAMGAYQILHTEAVDWGCIPTRSPGSLGTKERLTDAEIQTFLKDTAAQDACFAKGLEAKYAVLAANGLANGGGGYDCGALLAAAWLGDAVKVSKGTCVGDANNSSYTTCTRAQQFQGVCDGGDLNEVDAVYPGRSAFLACDPEVLNKNKEIVDALNQVNAEIIKATIQPPVTTEEMTCLDQQLKSIDASGSIHANPTGTLSQHTDDENPTKPKFNKLVTKQVTNNLKNMIAIPNAISSDISSMWSSLSSTFTAGGILSSITGGSSTTNCDMMESTWLLNQCIQMPNIPSLNDILSGTIGKVTGAITSLPDRLLEKVCKAANDAIGGVTSDLNNVFEDAANDALSPITDIGD